MTKYPQQFIVAAIAIAVSIVAPDALALAQRTFVRSDGLDANACSILQPCRSFATALLKTNAGGEIIVLDSAGYGPVTIGQSVSIVAPPGVYAGVSVLAGDGITINGDATAKVVLRGLSINGLGGGIGIRLQQGARLHIEGCEVSNMAGEGISIEAAGAEVFINDTIVRDNAGTGVILAATADVVIDRLRSERNGNGIYANQGNLTARDSVVSRNGFYGIAIETAATGSTLAIEGTLVVGNFADGIRARLFGPGTLDLVAARNTLIDNDWGVAINGAPGTVYAAVTDNVIKGSRNVGLLTVANSIMTSSGNTITRSGGAGIKAVSGTIRTRSNNTVMDNNPDLDPFTTLTPLGPL
jgi:hypothetical protein